MPVKVFVSTKDATKVAKELLAAAADAGLDSTHVRAEKTRGFGFIVSDELAQKLGLSEGDTATKNELDEVTVTRAPKPEVEPEPNPKPKRGRPAGKKNQEPSDGE